MTAQTLYRPVGSKELEKILADYSRSFPPKTWVGLIAAEQFQQLADNADLLSGVAREYIAIKINYAYWEQSGYPSDLLQQIRAKWPQTEVIAHRTL
ncbi:MAG: hypothetical protein HC880_16105 [Bacteroidia bacterium]|nr:hypothetical protein [Bacteroidia bacterium]